MSLLVLMLGIGLLATPSAVVASSLDSRTKARIGCAAIAAGMAATVAGLMLAASPLLFWWDDASRDHLDAADHLAPGGIWVWSGAGVVSTLSISFVVAAALRTRRLRRRAGLPHWAAKTISNEYGVEVRIASSDLAIAYAVPGRDPHVVVSEAVRDGLRAEQLRAVIAHENAHLQLDHQHYLFVLALYQRSCSWIPRASRTVDALRLAIEQWADSAAIEMFGADPAVMPGAFDFFPSASGTAHVVGARAMRLGSREKSSPCELLAVLALVLALVGAALYSTTHTVGELATIVATPH